VVVRYSSRYEKALPNRSLDAEWNYIEPHVPAPKEHGRPRIHSPREILNAIFFYLLRSGCQQWRLLPHDFPSRWPTVYYCFRAWRIDGTWERINRAIRERLRVRLERNPQPSAGIVDSQSVKTTGVGGEDRGYDGGKKVKGLKSATYYWWTPRVSYSQGKGHERQGNRLGRDQDVTAASRYALSPPQTFVGGRRLQGRR
jgi:transposase